MFRPYNRAGRAPGRPPVSKVFVPYTEEYLRRREMRRNAILADVIQPANLGHDPIATIKSALASRFGGYTEDFTIARFREREYAIILPEWANADVIVRRRVLTLDGFWLRCYPWGQYRNVRPHRPRFRAWIRLINLPFESWTIPRVAALVGGFGRFVKPDATTRAMTDLRAYRCQIIIDSVFDVPQNLAVVLGDEQFPVLVHLESWELIVEGGGGGPPAPPQNGPEEEREMEEDGNDSSHHSGGGGDLVNAEEEEDTGGVGEVEEGDEPPQNGTTTLGSTSHRPVRWGGAPSAVGKRLNRPSAQTVAQGGVIRGLAWAVVRDGRRRRSTVGQGTSTEIQMAGGSRCTKKMGTSDVCMDTMGANANASASCCPTLPVLCSREVEGPVSKWGRHKAPVDFALDTPEGQVDLLLNCLGMRVGVVASGPRKGQVKLWAWVFSPGPSLDYLPQSIVSGAGGLIRVECGDCGPICGGPDGGTKAGCGDDGLGRGGLMWGVMALWEAQSQRFGVRAKCLVDGGKGVAIVGGGGRVTLADDGEADDPEITEGGGGLVGGGRGTGPRMSNGGEAVGWGLGATEAFGGEPAVVGRRAMPMMSKGREPAEVGQGDLSMMSYGGEAVTWGVVATEALGGEPTEGSGGRATGLERRGSVMQSGERVEHTLTAGIANWGPAEGVGVESRLALLDASRTSPPDLTLPRASKRLANQGSAPILQRAMARKSMQREGGIANGGALNVERVIRKGSLCGVDLAAHEAKQFALFVNRRA